MCQKKSHFNHQLTKVINHTHNQIHTTQKSADNSTSPITSSQLRIHSQPPQINNIQTQTAGLKPQQQKMWNSDNIREHGRTEAGEVEGGKGAERDGFGSEESMALLIKVKFEEMSL